MEKVKRSTFKVLFYLKKNAPKKNGKVAIMGHITIDNQVAQFSTKLEILPQKRDLKYGRVTGKTATQLNRKLEEIRSRMVTHYDDLMKYEGVVTAQKLKATFLGIGVMEDSLLKVYEKFKEDFALMVEKGVRSWRTLNKYENVYTHLCEFILYKYHRSDISFKELTEDFINDFDFYLRVNKNLTHNTIWVYMMPLCKTVEIAIDKGIIYRNPFKNYTSSMEEKDRGYLLKEEVEALLQYHPKSASIELVRDLFVFSCFTGFSYIDIKQLKKSHLQSFFDGNKWLIKRRQKSDVPCNVRLLDIAEKIIEKYELISFTKKQSSYIRKNFLIFIQKIAPLLHKNISDKIDFLTDNLTETLSNDEHKLCNEKTYEKLINQKILETHSFVLEEIFKYQG